MEHLSINDMLEMQRALQEKYSGRWESITPENAKHKLLWMIGEASEVADIIKKNGDHAIMSNPAVRAHFTEELADTLMYFAEVMMCYGITEEELKSTYEAKFKRNLTRW